MKSKRNSEFSESGIIKRWEVMVMNIRVKSIPEEYYLDYRLDVIFEGYKWDLQAGEQSTISDKVVLLEQEEMSFLADSAVKLYQETIALERALQKNPELVLEMGISQKMTDALCSCDYNAEKHVRFMRFDFHPTTSGWKISEVNSDVPAGYPEASILPTLAQPYFEGYRQFGHFGNILVDRLTSLIPLGSTIAYLHDTQIIEDYQILHYLSDLMEEKGFKSMFAACSNLQWVDNHALGIDGIVRYFPVEWLEFTEGVDWISFINSKTTSCNHPIALLTQSKRLPLIWDKLGVEVPTWKKLLPETKCTNSLNQDKDWILKPAFGRVGEGINVPGTMSLEEEQAVYEAADLNPDQWVAQKVFKSLPIDGMHLTLGVFVVDSEFAGLYARGSAKPRIDSDASEIPVLVRGGR